ncbi:hypothetical protein [Salinimonas chungwhensis]|uniref:hypothetical protein n=1 Tax=Salinimonas chungwhensis TaxID=265425 RepID=UPI00035FEEB1|nr:hypothetical protein [Salinimonas chungwhensis]
MKKSTLKHISFESKSLLEVLRGEPGNYGVFLPVADDDGSYRQSIKKFSSQIKSRSTKLKVKCSIETLFIITNGEIPKVIKVIKVTRQ